MKTLKQISNFFGKYMSVIVLVVAALALFFPKSVSFIKTTYVNYLLMTSMFCMGITLKVEDFKVLFTRPKDIARCTSFNISSSSCCNSSCCSICKLSKTYAGWSLGSYSYNNT